MESKGIAVIIPAIWGETSMGKVTLTDEVPIKGIDIIAESTYTGTSAKLGVLFNPINTNQRDVVWSITSGSQYASISANGSLTIMTGANNSDITVKVASVDNADVFATKSIKVTYRAGGDVTLTPANYPDYTVDRLVINVRNDTYVYVDGFASMLVPVSGAASIEVGAAPNLSTICLVTNNDAPEGDPVPLAANESVIRPTVGVAYTYESIPSDAKFLYVMLVDDSGNIDTAPEYIKISY